MLLSLGPLCAVPSGACRREGHRYVLKQQCHHTLNGGAEDGGAQDGYPVKARVAPEDPRLRLVWSVGGQVRSRARAAGPLPPR